MSVNAILSIGSNSYDVLRCRYGFQRSVDSKGRPHGGMTGGEIIVELESTENTMLFERLIAKELHPVSGSLEIWDTKEYSRIRSFYWDEAYIYSYDESMDGRSGLPMTFTISITPLRLDIEPSVRIDRRWPETYGFWWHEYVPGGAANQGGTGEQAEEPEHEITDVVWKDADGLNVIESIPEDQIVTIAASVKYGEGETISFTIELEGYEPIELEGVVERGVAEIKGIDLKKYAKK